MKVSPRIIAAFLCAATFSAAAQDARVPAAGQQPGSRPPVTIPRPPAPEWARGIVWYQVQVDRFANGDPSNDPRARELTDNPNDRWEVSPWTKNWYQLSSRERDFNPSFYPNAFRRQYGGDLVGVRARLDYLASLGVQGIILSPVFESRSSHKYDVSTYHHIDRHFGPIVPSDTVALATETPSNPATWYTTAADRNFLDLVHDIHAHGMKVVLDVQFAHVGVHFWAFRDVLQNQEKSAFAPWFTVTEWDHPETPSVSEFAYKSMWGIEAFPELRKDSLGLAPGPRDYVFAATRHWMDPNHDGNPADGIDGWRVDLASELPARFWNDWVGLVKTTNPDALVIGGALDAEPGVPSPFDVVMSDAFGAEVVSFLVNRTTTPTGADRALSSHAGSENESDAADRRLNMIDNHETDRMASMCVNATNPYEENNSPQRNPRYLPRKPDARERAAQRLLVLLQFTYPGSPIIFYGDEAGMWGGDDPDCRKPMIWPDLTYEPECSQIVNGDPALYPVVFDSSLFNHYRQLVALRSDNLALRTGVVRTFLLDDVKYLYGFIRQSGANRVYTLINAGTEAQECTVHMPDVPTGSRIDAVLQHQIFYAERGGLTLVVPPLTGVVLVPTY